MRILGWKEYLGGGGFDVPTAATIGAFDGLHIGHRKLVSLVLGRAGLASAVVTFAESPKRVLEPARFRGSLSTMAQRLELIESMGVDLCVLIDFSGEFSKLPGRQFLSMLSASGKLRLVAVGSDFRCGRGLDTDAEDIRAFFGERSIEVELLQAVRWAGHPVSSSRIRKAILEGRLEEAALMLGRPYEVDMRGALRPAAGAFLPVPGQASPPPGEYEAELRTLAGGTPAVAELCADGLWRLQAEAVGELRGLRLFRVASRE